MLQTVIIPIALTAIFLGVYSQSSFYIPFQPQSEGATSTSTEQWIEFKNMLPSSMELTNCQWIRIKYRNIDLNPLWSYCTVESFNDTMKCLGLWLRDSDNSANRDMVLKFAVEEDNKVIDTFQVTVNNLLHRTWINFCLTVSTIENKTNL